MAESPSRFQAISAEQAAQMEPAPEHPLRRLMGQQLGTDGLELSFTDMRLARETRRHPAHVFHAQLSYHYDAAAQQLRIVVTR